MTRSEMNELVLSELRQYEHGGRGSDLGMFRALYYDYRMNSLGRKPQIPRSATAAREAAVSTIRQWNRTFEPVPAERT